MEMKKLQKPEIKESIQRRIHKNLDKINRRQEDINDQWEAIKHSWAMQKNNRDQKEKEGVDNGRDPENDRWKKKIQRVK